MVSARIRETAFGIGRAIGKHPAASRLFCMVERALPLDRLARTGRVVAFRHPRPSYQPHILVVPTTPFPALATPNLTAEQKAALLWEMIALAQSVANDQQATWRMIINGGERQEIGQVHGHLVHADDEPAASGLILQNPNEQFDAWQQLLRRVEQASGIAGNGYSVTFHLGPDSRVTAAFSASIPA